MKSRAFAMLLSVAGLCLVTYLAAEGMYSIFLWKDTTGSLTYKVYSQVGSASSADDEPPADLPVFQRVVTRAKIESLIPEFIKAGIAVGDVPQEGIYATNIGDVAITTQSPEGCRTVKPNIHKTMIQLRSNEYRPLIPPSLFFNADINRSDVLKKFLANYGLREAALNTNEFGERVTVPHVDSARKVLVVGDSLAFGASIDDGDTIASQLQRQDATRQYVTVATPAADASDVVCGVESAARRYHGQIDGLVYVYSHTDFSKSKKYGTPDEFLNWMKDFAEREKIGDVSVVLGASPYIIAPHYTRTLTRPKVWHLKGRALEEGAEAAGYRFINIADLALDEAAKRKTDFAIFALFMDGWGHLSPYGASKLVEEIRRPADASRAASRLISPDTGSVR